MKLSEINWYKEQNPPKPTAKKVVLAIIAGLMAIAQQIGE